MPFWLLRQGNKSRADEAEGNLEAIKRADDAAKPVDAMSDADVRRDLQSRGRGVTYNRYAFAVSVKDSSETRRDYDALDGAMEKACN
jgi:hypothetical protein